MSYLRKKTKELKAHRSVKECKAIFKSTEFNMVDALSVFDGTKATD